MMSALPPGDWATISRTGRSGNAATAALDANVQAAAATPASMTPAIIRCIVLPAGERRFTLFHEGSLAFLVIRALVAVVDHLLAQRKIALGRIAHVLDET